MISYESLRERIPLVTSVEQKSSNKTNVMSSTMTKTVAIGVLALLSIVVALTTFLFSIGHVMAQSGNTGSQIPTLLPPAQHFPPAFPPGNPGNFLRLQVVQRAGPSTNLGNGIGPIRRRYVTLMSRSWAEDLLNANQDHRFQDILARNLQ